MDTKEGGCSMDGMVFGTIDGQKKRGAQYDGLNADRGQKWVSGSGETTKLISPTLNDKKGWLEE